MDLNYRLSNLLAGAWTRKPPGTFVLAGSLHSEARGSTSGVHFKTDSSAGHLDEEGIAAPGDRFPLAAVTC